MKINQYISVPFLLVFSCNLFAKTIDISYDGKPISKDVSLVKDDVVMINTTVNINTKVMISVTPVGKVNENEFTFASSMENVSPDRMGPFTDQMFTGANPGWVSYTYTGKNKVKAKFNINP